MPGHGHFVTVIAYHWNMEEFDLLKPSVARVHNAMLGGKDNFFRDREVVAKLDEVSPYLVKSVAEGREFLERAVTYAAEQGVSQFLDLGAGIPQPPVTHEVVRRVLPYAHVAYVDHDPQVLAHLTAWYGNNDDLVTVVNADVEDHARVLGSLRDLDLTGPCCVILGMLPHLYPAARAAAMTASYAAALAPGSYLVASSAYGSRGRAAKFWAAYSESVRQVHPHPPETFAAFFDGLELVPPGISDVRSWHPGWPAVPPAAGGVVLCGMARKP